MYEDNPFIIRQPQQQQQQQQQPFGLPGLNSLLSNFMPGSAGGPSVIGGSGGSGGLGAGGGGLGAGGTASTTGTAGGGSTASGIGGAASAAGPWAALAAIILANETWASKTGHRRGKLGGKKHLKDALTTEVWHQDWEERIAPKLGFDEDSKWAKGIGMLINPNPLNFKKQWKRLKDIF